MAKSSRNFLIFVALLACLPAPILGARKRAPRAGGSRGLFPRLPPPRTPAPNPGDLPEGDLNLAAKGAIVIDSLTGKTLYERTRTNRSIPASTTKIMTALLVIEAGDLDKEVEVSLEDSKVGESSLELKPGPAFSPQADALRTDAEKRERRRPCSGAR